VWNDKGSGGSSGSFWLATPHHLLCAVVGHAAPVPAARTFVDDVDAVDAAVDRAVLMLCAVGVRWLLCRFHLQNNKHTTTHMHKHTEEQKRSRTPDFARL
jgi:hypothetical protein